MAPGARITVAIVISLMSGAALIGEKNLGCAETDHRLRGEKGPETPENTIPWQDVPFSGSIQLGIVEGDGVTFTPRDPPVFFEGDTLAVRIQSARSGYLYVFYLQVDGRVIQLFPMERTIQRRIVAGQTLTIPEQGENYSLTMRPPFGEERVMVFVTDEPLSLTDLPGGASSDEAPLNIPWSSFVKAVVFSQLRGKSASYSAGVVSLSVRPRTLAIPEDKNRLAFFIGISRYQQTHRFRALRWAASDAEEMARVMSVPGGFKKFATLTDRQATFRAIQEHFARLADVTREGDEILIFWSGHGGKCPDTGQLDETDGYDEYLAVHDSVVDQTRQENIVLDDLLGEWVGALQKRKVCLIIDTCYAGGLSSLARGDNGQEAADFARDMFSDLFMAGQDPSPRDVAPLHAIMLCACQDSEMALDRGMTHLLVQEIEKTRPLALREAYLRVSPRVKDLARRLSPRFQQTVHLLPDDPSLDFVLRR